MKVVIELDKKIYQQAILLQSRGEGSVYAQIIANGTPLPKGHGELIDRDKVLMHESCKFRGDCPVSGGTPCNTCGDNCVEVAEIVKATTIIPADDSVDMEEED